MTSRQVILLGSIGLRADGAEITLPGRRTRAVLAMLALNAGRVVTVDQLLDGIWGEEVTSGSTNTLQSYVSALRNAVGDTSFVVRRGPGYVLGVETDDVDALRFEALVARARSVAEDPVRVLEALDAALDLWRGRPLADVDGESFAPGPVARLVELRVEALERGFDAELSLGRHAEVIGRLEEALAEHPLKERLAGQLALAQYRSGRQAEALATIGRVRERLLEDLGLSPGDALVELERLILNQDASLAPPPQARPAPVATPPATELPRPAAVSRTHPLVGRRDELDRLLRLWTDAQARRSSVVVVSGEAGVGKTRLIAELAATVHRDHGRVVWGRCTEGRGLPYEPFVEAVTTLTGRTSGAFSEISSGSAVSAPELGVLALHDAVASTLTDGLSRGGVLVLDDVQWADGRTASMLTHVVEAVLALPVLVVVARRAGPTGEVDRALDGLRRTTRVHRIDLTGLERDDVGEIVSDTRGADPGLAERLHEYTGGNPFFVHELLAADDDSAPPVTVAEAVGLRVGPADRPLGRLLGAAAVVDRDADLRLLAAVAGLEEEDALTALDAALAGDLLRESGERGGDLSFSHAIVQEAAYHTLTSARRQHLHFRAASALAERHRSAAVGAHSVEIAQHLLAAGRLADVVELLDACRSGAEWCLGVLAYDEALGLAEAGLAAADPSTDPAHRRAGAWLQVRLADALNASGRTDDARARLRGVLEVGQQLDDGSLAAAAALAMTGGPGAGVGMRWGVVDEELVAALDTALARVQNDDDHTRARLLAASARALYNDPDAAARCDHVSAEAVTLAERLGEPGLLGDALIARCIGLWRPARLAERLPLAQRAAALAAEEGDDGLAVAAALRLLPDAFEAADLATVRSSLATLDATTSRLRQPRYRWFVPLATSALALTTSDHDAAQAAADEALDVAGGAQADGPALSHLVGSAMIARDRGAMTTLEDELQRRVGTDDRNLTPRILLAVLEAETDRADAALRLVSEHLEPGLPGLPRDYLWLGHLGLLAEVVTRAGTPEHAELLLTELDLARGRLLMLGATAPVGAADRALSLLTATTGDLETALGLALKARDLHESIGATYLLARTEADRAVLHRAARYGPGAAAARDRAEALAEEVGLPRPTSPLAGRLSPVG